MGILSGIGAGIGAAAGEASEDAHQMILSDIEQNRQQALAQFSNNLQQGNIQLEHQNRLDEMQQGANIDVGKQTGLLAANADFNKQQYADIETALQPKLAAITQQNAASLGIDPSDPKAAPSVFQRLDATAVAAGEAGLGADKVLPILDKSATAEAGVSIKQAMLDIRQQNADSLDRLRDSMMQLNAAKDQRLATLAAGGLMKTSDFQVAADAAARLAQAKRDGTAEDPSDVAKVALYQQLLGSKHAGDTITDTAYDKNGNPVEKTTRHVPLGSSAPAPQSTKPLVYDPATGTFK